MFRIDLATGEVIRTPTPLLEAHSTMVAGRDWVMMKAITGPEGPLVRDGSAAAALPTALRGDAWLHRGPGDRVWQIPEQPAWPDPPRGQIRLIDLDGRVVPGHTITIDPVVGAPVDDDGYGGLLLATRTAVYQLTPSASAPTGTARVRLVTRGGLLGIGGRRVLVWDTAPTTDSRTRVASLPSVDRLVDLT